MDGCVGVCVSDVNLLHIQIDCCKDNRTTETTFHVLR